ncbi:MAG: hypothetical protein JHC87_01840 [Thermoleophilaceae bacterium]|nr:hypothetical protein [Thermoleophilaceae bacterium]
MARIDQFLISVTVGGVDLKYFDKRTGGLADSEETKYSPGGGEDDRSLGGRPIHNNCTVTREWIPERDAALMSDLRAACGNPDKGHMVITQQPLDADGGKLDDPTVYTGTLKSVLGPEADSTASGAALLTLEQTTVKIS